LNLPWVRQIKTSQPGGPPEAVPPAPSPSGSGAWPKAARILLLVLVILLGYGCAERNQHPPEQLLYVRPCPPEKMAAKPQSPCLCLEFMLADSLGAPTTSDGKVTVKLLKDAKLRQDFKVKRADFQKRPSVPKGSAHASGAARNHRYYCLIGPISLPKSSGKNISLLFEFERPDGQLFRRKVTFSL
jgi:hypothetical protein